jgi:hypothetical protein
MLNGEDGRLLMCYPRVQCHQFKWECQWDSDGISVDDKLVPSTGTLLGTVLATEIHLLEHLDDGGVYASPVMMLPVRYPAPSWHYLVG